MILTPKGIYAARDKYGRTPLVIGHKEDAYCMAMESFSFQNLGYRPLKELGPGEIVIVNQEGIKTLMAPQDADLHILVGVLWLSIQFLRGNQC